MNILCVSTDADTDRKLHIVYMGSLVEGQYSPSSQHLTMLQEVVTTSSPENILVRSYKRSFNGFAAKLTDNEKQKLSNMNGVVSVFPSRILQLHTTRSWDFMGFNESTRRKRDIESNIIVGVIDGGIWPELESFSDEGFGPPPKRWKGTCSGGKNFTCNNKIIGARYYNTSASRTSARDEEASTTDRLIVDNIILGNGETVVGTSINIFSLDGKKLPLVLGKEVVHSPNCGISELDWCSPGCIDGRKAKGKIVICYSYIGYPEVHRAGAAGSIMNNDVFGKVYPVVSIPASVVTSKEYNAVLSYMNSTKNPQAEILKSEAIKDSDAPVVAKFSSRGPNSILSGILKVYM
ncbi:hypothetical protein Q3G72_016302 [Acer saccharum]|nr:hypothetical protein Q3G72_016302 [Acer saccharum]